MGLTLPNEGHGELKVGLAVKARNFLLSPEFRMFICLVLLLRVNLAIKLTGILFAFFTEPNFRFGLRRGRIPLFYAAMAFLVIVQFPFNVDRGASYFLVAILAFVFWMAGLLVVHQVALWSEKYGPQTIRTALVWFFFANALVTFATLVGIMFETGAVNPYQYTGENFKYFASTGDHLRGITGDISTVNMVLNGFGTLYFLYHGRYAVSLLCFLVALVTTSNIGNLILAAFLLAVIVAHPKRLVKSIAICYVAFLVSFIVKISPSNLNYLNNKFAEIFRMEKKPISIKYEDHSEKDILISNYVTSRRPAPDTVISSKRRISYLIREQRFRRTIVDSATTKVVASEEEKSRKFFTEFFKDLYGDTLENLDRGYYASAPGKLLSFRESVSFALSRPSRLLFGAGAGNFSSRIAVKATNLGLSGRYIGKYSYIAPEFSNHHLKLILRYYMLPVPEHSVINFANSVFNQLLGEYGLAGLVFFLVFYAWFFISRFRRMQSTRLLLFMLAGFLMLDYWFESLSIVIIFELMAFSEINDRVIPQDT